MSGLKPGPISEARAKAMARTTAEASADTGVLHCVQDDGIRDMDDGVGIWRR